MWRWARGRRFKWPLWHCLRSHTRLLLPCTCYWNLQFSIHSVSGGFACIETHAFTCSMTWPLASCLKLVFTCSVHRIRGEAIIAALQDLGTAWSQSLISDCPLFKEADLVGPFGWGFRVGWRGRVLRRARGALWGWVNGDRMQEWMDHFSMLLCDTQAMAQCCFCQQLMSWATNLQIGA